jgi:hypothetical protein
MKIFNKNKKFVKIRKAIPPPSRCIKDEKKYNRQKIKNSDKNFLDI